MKRIIERAPLSILSSFSTFYNCNLIYCKRQGKTHKRQGKTHKRQGKTRELQGNIHELQGNIHELQGNIHELQGNIHELQGVFTTFRAKTLKKGLFY